MCLQTRHDDVIDGWVGKTDGHFAAVLFLPRAETLDQLLVAIDLRYPEDLVLELEEIVTLNIDGHDVLIYTSTGSNRLNMPGAEPDADVAVVAGAGGHQQYCNQRYYI